MKKIVKAVLLAAAFALAFLIPKGQVKADTVTGSSDWNVTFTNNKEMVSNFKSNNLDEVIYGLQPGDNAKLTMQLTNEYDEKTDWYMTNEVLSSLENSSENAATKGGAYSYKLVYTNPSGEKKVLYDSEAVGGDDVSPAGEGLKEATDALKDYFYLDTLSKGQTARIDLDVGLEGETQGNDYQDTLADLQMNFAVELSKATDDDDKDSNSSNRTKRTTVVKTGDDNEMLPYFLIAGAGGLFLLTFLLLCLFGKHKRKEGA